MTLTIKQENFAQAYVETSNQSEAYRRAYNAENMKAETVHKRASELMQNGDVAGRIAELKQEHAQRHAITIDIIRDMLLEDRAFAKEMESASSAVTATTALAKLYGLMRDKVEHTGKDGGPIQTEVRDVNASELIEEAKRLGIDPAAMGILNKGDGND